MEIERKFLIERLPDELDRHSSSRIEQGYLALDDDSGAEVRLRRRGGELTLTVKGAGRVARVEVELEPGEAQFESLWPLTEGRRVEKTRHLIPAGELRIELDVYEGALEGLVVAEVEFPSDDAAARFKPPEWFGPEVTDDGRYKNRALAVDGLPES
jgi:CYTH domain-containing protein